MTTPKHLYFYINNKNVHPRLTSFFIFLLMKYGIVLTFLLSIVSLCSALFLLANRQDGPFFIDSYQTISNSPHIQSINNQIAIQNEAIKRQSLKYSDSIARLLDTLSIKRGEQEETLIELMNLESNIFRHKKIDSLSRESEKQLTLARQAFNSQIESFCVASGISVLFASNNNTVIFGSGTKADKTQEFNHFIESN